MSEHRIRYIVGHGWADAVGDATALPHRVLRIDARGDITVRIQRPRQPEQSRLILQMSGPELAFLAREARRAARRRFWYRLLGIHPVVSIDSRPRWPDSLPKAADLDNLASGGIPALSRGAMEYATAIRRHVGPMRNNDGSIDASAVAREQTLRSSSGLPSYIAELDGPGKVE